MTKKEWAAMFCCYLITGVGFGLAVIGAAYLYGWRPM